MFRSDSEEQLLFGAKKTKLTNRALALLCEQKKAMTERAEAAEHNEVLKRFIEQELGRKRKQNRTRRGEPASSVEAEPYAEPAEPLTNGTLLSDVLDARAELEKRVLSRSYRRKQRVLRTKFEFLNQLVRCAGLPLLCCVQHAVFLCCMGDTTWSRA